MGDTKIQWATKVWNPVSGCTKVSQGCKNCYAETIAKRFWGERKFSAVICHEERLNEPLHWHKPQRVFVDSMGDLFHPDVPNGFIFGVFMRMVKAFQHTFIILTKRPERMHEWITTKWMVDFEDNYVKEFELSNVWLGVSVEDQATADERIPLLLETPAAVRFVSYEPALEKIDISKYLAPFMTATVKTPLAPATANALAQMGKAAYRQYVGPLLDWVIMGCESGPCARPMDIEWARSVRDQCVAAGAPFFFKQKRIGNKILHTPSLDGVYWQQFPEGRG